MLETHWCAVGCPTVSAKPLISFQVKEAGSFSYQVAYLGCTEETQDHAKE